MSRPFPEQDYLTGNFRPWPMEGRIDDVQVEGRIPEALCGSYYKNGSNPQYAPGPGYHWFEGDGMVHAFHFEGGRARYLNRWVRTERFLTERKHGEALFSGLGPQTGNDPRIEGKSPNASNTNVVWHAGRLLTLWEAGAPYELDPLSLETIGVCDFDGAFMRDRYGSRQPDIMTAHPKIDPDLGEWVGFGYSPLPPYLVHHVVDAKGRLTRSFPIESPFPSMMHDFIVSSGHVIFPVFPAVFDLSTTSEDGLPVVWQPEKGTHVGVLPRGGDADDVVWIETDPCFSFHTVSARTEGSSVIAELFVFPQLGMGNSANREPTPPRLHRWTIDLQQKKLREELLDDAPAEFGRIDERFMGKDYRHTWTLGSLGLQEMYGEPEKFNCLFHYDLATGERRAHRLPVEDSVGEPIFVPRGPAAEKGDGWVMAIVHRVGEDRSDLIILDTRHFEDEPVATLQLPHAIPYGFHGNWRPGRSSSAACQP